MSIKSFHSTNFLKDLKNILEIDRDAAWSEKGDLVANLHVKPGNYAHCFTCMRCITEPSFTYVFA